MKEPTWPIFADIGHLLAVRGEFIALEWQRAARTECDVRSNCYAGTSSTSACRSSTHVSPEGAGEELVDESATATVKELKITTRWKWSNMRLVAAR